MQSLVARWEATEDTSNTELDKEETDQNNNNYTKKNLLNSVKVMKIYKY